MAPPRKQYPNGLKRCSKCGVEKPLSEFYLQKDTTNDMLAPRPFSQCKPCQCARVTRYRTAHLEQVKARRSKHWYEVERLGPRKYRDSTYRRRYNSTLMAYDLLLQAQDGRCAVCGCLWVEGMDMFAFDHDHATGLCRGVLCAACNGGLGCFRDNPELLRKAAMYLRRWEAEHQRVQEGATIAS